MASYKLARYSKVHVTGLDARADAFPPPLHDDDVQYPMHKPAMKVNEHEHEHEPKCDHWRCRRLPSAARLTIINPHRKL